ncbi:MAG: DMT family transporter [Chloroflexi bacterium]|nr:DMT family transporter [Chloroflexota bacterium]
MLSIVFGLLSALTWGAGDFTGGLGTRKVGAACTVFYASIVGLIAVVITALVSGEIFPAFASILFATLAGMFGCVGLLLLYAAMARGLMSIAAPVSALLAAALPVLAGSLTEGLPETLTLIGFAFALFAVWMVSQGEGGVSDLLSHLSDLKLPLLAGMGFGFYFVLMHNATGNGHIFWPMVASRTASVLLLMGYMLITQTSFRITDMSALPVIGLNGILDLTGNGFFILAAQAGRLDVASVLSALYPGSTVMLAWVFLHERLTRNQWIGIVSALTAIVLMTI